MLVIDQIIWDRIVGFLFWEGSLPWVSFCRVEGRAIFDFFVSYSRASARYTRSLYLAPVQRCASGVGGCAAQRFPPTQRIGREVVSAIGQPARIPLGVHSRAGWACLDLIGVRAVKDMHFGPCAAWRHVQDFFHFGIYLQAS